MTHWTWNQRGKRDQEELFGYRAGEETSGIGSHRKGVGLPLLHLLPWGELPLGCWAYLLELEPGTKQ